MRLRGAFDPRIQILLGGLSVSILISSAVWLWSNAHRPSPENWIVLDLRVMPISLLIGLLVGWRIGRLRLTALKAALPEIDGRMFLSQIQTLSKFREGENAIKLQRTGFILAFLVWFALTTFTDGRVLLYGSMVAYIVGQYLTGQTLPFILLASSLPKDA